jgi:chaperone required for assembly of F1-ATPase
MRDIFTEIFENQSIDPVEAARRSTRPNLRKRFYEAAQVGEGGAVLLDDKPVKTPARRALRAPTLALAEAIVREWNSQIDVIDPARMPLTRLANAIIDAVTDAPQSVAEDEKIGGPGGDRPGRHIDVPLPRDDDKRRLIVELS